MGVITIEYGDRIEVEPCPCCGGQTTCLTRFVYSDGDAHAVYYAAFSNNHPDRIVSVLISLGEWGKDGTPADRIAFAVHIRATETNYEVMVVDAAQPPWRDEPYLGRRLDREEALKHSWIEEVFHITDHIVAEDREVRNYFEVRSSTT